MTYFRLNVEQGMQEVKLSEWERLSKVEAHTAQYLRRKEVDGKLALLGKIIIVPKVGLTVEQLGKKKSIYGLENVPSLPQYLLGYLWNLFKKS